MSGQKKNNKSSSSNSRRTKVHSTDFNGMKWKQTFSTPATNAILSTRKLKVARGRNVRKSPLHSDACRKYVKISHGVKQALVTTRPVRLALPAPTQVKGAWALKSTPFESYSPFDSRFPVMQKKKRREQSKGFLTFSPFDSRFPTFFESYSPWDARFPHGPVPKAFPSFSPFDSRFPVNGVINFRGLARGSSAVTGSAKKSAKKPVKGGIQLPLAPTTLSMLEHEMPVAQAMPRFTPSARTNVPNASVGFFGWLAGAAPVAQPQQSMLLHQQAPSPLSSVLQRFAGFGSPTVGRNYNGYAQR